MLKVFNGFQLDMAADFTDMSPSKINTLRKKGILKPEKTSEGYCYSFADILTLRLCQQLRENNVPLNNVYNAHEYLQNWDPGRSLLHIKIKVRDPDGQILEIIDNETVICLSQFGQLIHSDIVRTISVGKEMEKVRLNVLAFEKTVTKGMEIKRTVSVEAMKRHFGIA